MGITIDPDVWRKSRMQQILASEGRAENQCPCGSYTTTGEPPVLHRAGCPHDEFPLVESSPDDEPPRWWE